MFAKASVFVVVGVCASLTGFASDSSAQKKLDQLFSAGKIPTFRDLELGSQWVCMTYRPTSKGIAKEPDRALYRFAFVDQVLTNSGAEASIRELSLDEKDMRAVSVADNATIETYRIVQGADENPVLMSRRQAPARKNGKLPAAVYSACKARIEAHSPQEMANMVDGVYVFDDDVINGERAGGDGENVNGRVGAKFKSLVQPRADFNKEMIKTAEQTM